MIDLRRRLLPFADWPNHTATTLFAVQTAGFRPILAHLERYAEVKRDPNRAVNLNAMGNRTVVSSRSTSCR